MLLVNDSTIGVVEVLLPAVPGPGPGVGDAAEGRHLLAAPEVRGAQVLAAVVQRVEVEAVGVAVAVAGVATVPLVERPVGVVEQDLPAPGQRRLRGASQGDRPGEARRLGVDHLDGVGQVVGDVERLAVGGEGQLGRPAARRDATEPAVAVEQLDGDQVARAPGAPGEPLQVGPEDHHLVGPAATDGQVAAVVGDGHAVGVGGGLAAGVEREGGIRLRAVERRRASGAGRAPIPCRCCSTWWRTPDSSCWRRSPSGRRARGRPAGGCPPRPTGSARPSMSRPRSPRGPSTARCRRAAARRRPRGPALEARGRRPGGR